MLQAGEAPAELPRLPIEGAAQLLLVHRSSSDERADSAAADTCASSFWKSGSDAYRDTRFHGQATLPIGPTAPRDVWESAPYVRMLPKLFEHLRTKLGTEVQLLHDVHERVQLLDGVLGGKKKKKDGG